MGKEKEDAFDVFMPFKLGFVVVMIIGCLYYLVSKFLPSFSFEEKKFSKKEMAKYYKVDKKTFNKWSVFWVNTYGILDDYPNRKLLNVIEASFIVYKLGNPKKYPVMTKKEIIEQGEGTYKSLRESINAHPNKFGITAKTFKSLTKFPPRIAKNIKNQFG